MSPSDPRQQSLAEARFHYRYVTRLHDNKYTTYQPPRTLVIGISEECIVNGLFVWRVKPRSTEGRAGTYPLLENQGDPARCSQCDANRVEACNLRK